MPTRIGSDSLNYKISEQKASEFDERKHYRLDKIKKIEFVSSGIVSFKFGLGTFGRAVTGRLVFGGVSTFVGGMASTNKAKLHQIISVKFTYGRWIVATLDNPAPKDREFGLMQSKALCHQDCPI